MRWLCLGGTFDPIHYGHIICARSAAASLHCDAVRVIPAAVNPHKQQDASLTSAEHRLSMCQLAVAGESGFVSDDVDLGRPAPSYTFDTVTLLRRELTSGDSLVWLIGADHLPRLHAWHRFDELRGLVEFAVMNRPGFELDATGLSEPVREIASRAVVVPDVPISATDIRARVRSGKSIDGLTPPAVARYIRENGLYFGA